MFKDTLHIPTHENVTLFADIVIPDNAKALVIFSHSSGNSRFNPRNKFIAEMLQREGIATLIPDLLTLEENQDYDNRFEIELLTERLIAVTEWIMESALTKDLNIGYLGSSTGTAAALCAEARLGKKIRAIVSRSGRADLSQDALPKVKCPVLLIAGALDQPFIQLNRAAYLYLDSIKELMIVPGASHSFEEHGKLEEAGRLTVHWFEEFLLGKEKNIAA